MSYIGIKRLTTSDLGWSLNSNQTHIGLNSNSIKYSTELDKSILNCDFIHNNSNTKTVCYLNYIFRNGIPMEPKIRKGSKNIAVKENSVLELIRKISSKKYSPWYIGWKLIDNLNIKICLFSAIDYKYLYLLNSDEIRHKLKKENFNFTIDKSNIYYEQINKIFNYEK